MNITAIHGLTFQGRFVGGKWYTDREINDAKRFHNVENWEELYRAEFEEDKKVKIICKQGILKAMLNDILLGIPRWNEINTAIDNEFLIKLLHVRELMVHFNNEEIDAEGRKADKIADQTCQAKFENAVLDVLKKEFFGLLEAEAGGQKIQVPTGIMLAYGSEQEREKIKELIKDKSGCYFIETTHKDDEDATIYRIETELERAKERYNSSGIRTILYIENFSNILNPQETSPASISRLKNIMSDMGVENLPLTILFHTNDTTGILDAFLVNTTRIPLKINLKELKDAQKP